MSTETIRVIKIKTGVVKRLLKEKITYEKEASQQMTHIEKLKEDGKDEHLIKKQEEVLQETLMMVPDCQRRLLKAIEELKKVIEDEPELGELEVLAEAKQILTISESQLKKKN